MEQQTRPRSYFSPEFESLESRVFNRAVSVLGTAPRARRWMDTSKWHFNGLTPVQMLRTDKGTRKVETMLGQINAGIFN